ncbi:unnamed protein product [Rangifer tarandus platyrhynchus]|uniref:Uncharacterized protein n=1 Tax=Rangifer tarandus platyrhynchus TaxID=3082113 RepID=A0AC59YA08_RANTA
MSPFVRCVICRYFLPTSVYLKTNKQTCFPLVMRTLRNDRLSCIYLTVPALHCGTWDLLLAARGVKWKAENMPGIQLKIFPNHVLKVQLAVFLAAYSKTQEVVGKWQQFSSERDGASWGDLCQCLETFLVVRPGEVATGI